jgi:predicted metallopeptidase
MTKTRSHLHMFQRIFNSTKFSLYLYMFIFVIEQDIWVMRSNGILKSRSIARGYQTSMLYVSMLGLELVYMLVC